MIFFVNGGSYETKISISQILDAEYNLLLTTLTTLHWTVLYCTALQNAAIDIVAIYYTALQEPVIHCPVLYPPLAPLSLMLCALCSVDWAVLYSVYCTLLYSAYSTVLCSVQHRVTHGKRQFFFFIQARIEPKLFYSK